MEYNDNIIETFETKGQATFFSYNSILKNYSIGIDYGDGSVGYSLYSSQSYNSIQEVATVMVLAYDEGVLRG